ncbi:hypothetical protein BCR34DRAFT_604536 [Clohesyomyces aquaticus]|uniref:Uncharacterized protein n=1 Tax=Clohesyomyces aquaticus TaxID=1231657 RepID=A0A1Y1Z5W2_9PLEO|nr:hypothetical protein BCR34DRAFT_604536 [Clohesyomyces aquaticus]
MFKSAPKHVRIGKISGCVTQYLGLGHPEFFNLGAVTGNECSYNCYSVSVLDQPEYACCEDRCITTDNHVEMVAEAKPRHCHSHQTLTKLSPNTPSLNPSNPNDFFCRFSKLAQPSDTRAQKSSIPSLRDPPESGSSIQTGDIDRTLLDTLAHQHLIAPVS